MTDDPNRRNYAHKEEITEFLFNVWNILAQKMDYDAFIFVPRKENEECVTSLGITKEEVRDTIVGLGVEDYVAGALDDKDFPGELWVFGKIIEGKSIYIKIKLTVIGDKKVIRVVSFHFATWGLYFPYK